MKNQLGGWEVIGTHTEKGDGSSYTPSDKRHLGTLNQGAAASNREIWKNLRECLEMETMFKFSIFPFLRNKILKGIYP